MVHLHASLTLITGLQIRGRVETCGIQVSHKFINIPLSPAIVISGGKEVYNCLANDQLVLTVRKPRSTKCLSEMELVKYLRGKTLYVYTRNRRRLQCASKKLTIKNKDKAFILVSGENDAMFKDILREKRVWWK
ncbi:hypothetical protein BaRGS_00016418 [Batillaria attramentaria]|uniref:Uncharacterized protein n=1 Tax=Batillaria attramentaria TaxID=370345 RepID=A0ABD0KZ89_9CAEN